MYTNINHTFFVSFNWYRKMIIKQNKIKKNLRMKRELLSDDVSCGFIGKQPKGNFRQREMKKIERQLNSLQKPSGGKG